MKKCKILLALLLVFSCTSCTKEEIKEEKPLDLLNKEDIIDEVYVDDSYIPLGIYSRDNYQYKLIDNEIVIPWVYWTDIGVFTIFPTKEKSFPRNYVQDIYKPKWEALGDTQNNKIGFNLSFSTTEGEVSSNILKPSDRFNEAWDYIAIFLYDDVNITRGAWHDHLDDEEVNENTIYSSVKLFAHVKSDNVTSPIKLTVFAYNNENDFDPETGEYRGKSYHEIYIKKK